MNNQSHQLFQEALRYMPGGVNSPVRAFRAVGGEPFFAQRAEGSRVYDVDGKSYIDYVCTWGPSIAGHAAPEVVEAVIYRARMGTSFGIPNPLEVDLARKICEWVPSVEKVRMCNSGTEATMTCIRLARGFTGRDKILKFEGCYHGHSDSLLVKAGSGSLTLGLPDSAGVPQSFAQHTLTLPFNDFPLLEKIFVEAGELLAAVIVEPIPANAGLILPCPGYLERLRELCSQYEVVLIFDEVMTGFRLAKGGAQEILGIKPDLSAFGKVIGGGLPVGALGGKKEIMDWLAPLGPVYQAGTLSGNPLAMAAGLAQLNILEKNNGFARLERMGGWLEAGLRDILKKTGKDYCLKRIGSMFCLFAKEGDVWNLEDAKKSDLSAFGKLFHSLLSDGIYLAPSQFETGFISLAHREVDIEETLRAFHKALS